jgi:hypothetical protein
MTLMVHFDLPFGRFNHAIHSSVIPASFALAPFTLGAPVAA